MALSFFIEHEKLLWHCPLSGALLMKLSTCTVQLSFCKPQKHETENKSRKMNEMAEYIWESLSTPFPSGPNVNDTRCLVFAAKQGKIGKPCFGRN
jgi:hypothetical protein